MRDGARVGEPAPPHFELKVIADRRQNDERNRHARGPRVRPERQYAHVAAEQQGCHGADQSYVQLENGTHGGTRTSPASPPRACGCRHGIGDASGWPSFERTYPQVKPAMPTSMRKKPGVCKVPPSTTMTATSAAA